MASIIKVDTIQDQDGNNIISENANVITIGASGDTITIPSGATLANSGIVTGFQSTGIDDNATSTAITINSSQHVELHGGQIESNNNTSSITYSGGNNSNAGANLTLFGGSHATTPNVARFRSSATEVMRIDSSGNVGIGTTNTSPRLYVVSNSNQNGMILDCVGTPSNYHFDVRNDNSSIFRIDSSGNVGIGTSSPSFLLDLSGTSLNNSTVTSSSIYGLRANLHASFAQSGTTLGNMDDQRNLGIRNEVKSSTTNSPVSNGVALAFQHYGGSGLGNGTRYVSQMVFGHSSSPSGNIYFRNSDVSNGTTFSNWFTVDLTNTSDIRSKENIINAPEQITRLKNLNVKQFNYINNTEGTNDLGLIAQEADEIIPEYVTKDEENPEIMWRVLYNKMTPMLIKCIQEQQTKIEELEARITALETNQP